MSRRHQHQRWIEEIRKPAEAAAEPRRTLKVDGAIATYQLAQLPDGTWAITWNLSYFGGSMSGQGVCWSKYPNREACLTAFLVAARELFSAARLPRLEREAIAAAIRADYPA